MKNLKQIVIIGLSLVVFVAGLGLESAFSRASQAAVGGQLVLHVPADQTATLTHENAKRTVKSNERQELQVGDKVVVGPGSGAEIEFSKRGVVRLAAESVVSVQFLDSQKDSYVISLEQGRAWVNSLYTSANMNVMANGVYLMPDYAVADVQIDDQKTLVYANRHQVIVGLIPLNFQPKSAKFFSPSERDLARLSGTRPDEDFINSYLLSQGNQTTVFAQKIKENEATLRKLFYSKLIKEFPFGSIDPQLLSSDVWIKRNIEADKTFESAIREETEKQVRARGLKVSDLDSFGYSFGQSLNGFYNFLTFFEPKVVARVNDNIFDHFDDAKYLLLFGQTNRAKERLEFFTKSLDAALSSKSVVYKTDVLLRLQKEYESLAFVTPDNSMAPAKSAIASFLLSKLDTSEADLQQKFLLIRNTMNDVYDLAESGSQFARQSFEEYFAQLTPLLSLNQIRLKLFSNIVAEENQIMDNLLHQYPMFYRDGFFAVKNQLEQSWLALVPEGESKNEEKQTIVSNKIDFLRQLKTYFLADKIAADDAKQIVFRLFREADDLQLPSDKQVAVNELYAKRLQDFGIFYRYLTSPEYVAGGLHGPSRKNQFDEFVQKAQQQQQDKVSFDQLRKEVLANEGDVTAAAQVPVAPLVSPPPPASASAATPPVAAPVADTKSQRVAKILLLQKLKTNGITATEQDIEIVDLTANLFRVKHAGLTLDATSVLSFDFDNDSGMVSKLVLTSGDSPRNVDGSFALSQVSAQIQSLQ